MKRLSIIAGCLILMAGISYGQTQSFDLVAFGTSNHSISLASNSTFTLTLNGTVSGYTADGFSMWLEAPTQNGFAGALQITNRTYFQFPDGTQNVYPKVFTDPAGADAGYLSARESTRSGDLGATANQPSDDFTGTRHLADYSFSITNATPGTYILRTTSLSPKNSGVADDSFSFHNVSQALFTVTIVPEPATWSLLGLGTLGSLGLTWLRARRK